MKQLKIKYLALSTYIVLGGIAGLILGAIHILISIPIVVLNSIELELSIIPLVLIQLVVGPAMYGSGGILLALITYIPYKLIMKYRGGMFIKYRD